ncbi:Venom plasminogen activator [Seminavis robusta]|uniref:Venom plasminogen activator n=1 Tax=Seminavis robusta TaxID=568900 RepID=A0A9N8DRK6_9STRA|nr:Venom plasminogen activator [Seminavis robusta]|eukprot:Sro204_g085830.1 Venom plasminogen activator (364) ;mRNA; r:25074-26279
MMLTSICAPLLLLAFLLLSLCAVASATPTDSETEHSGDNRLRGFRKDEDRWLDASPRVVGGVDTPFSRTWIAVIGTSSSPNQCHGTLVSADFVLTSATCISSAFGGIPSRVVVMPNDNNMRTSPISVANHFIHPCADSSRFRWDVALLKLGTVLSSAYGPVTFADSDTQVFNGNYLRIIGFGAASDSDRTSASPALQEATLSYERLCGSSIPGYDAATHLCANAPNTTDVGPCDGDSGSPIGLTDLDATTGAFTQVGILTGFYRDPNTGSARCGDDTHYHLYTRVSSVSNWAKTIICDNTAEATKPSFCNSFDRDGGGGVCATSGGDPPPCAPREWLQQAANQITSFVGEGSQQVFRFFGGGV